jgi:hypothetical protein
VSLGRYALVVAALLGVGLAGLSLFPGAAANPGTRPAAAFGAGLAAVNTLLAYFSGVWSRTRSNRAFFLAILGGMLGRLLLLLSAVLIGVLVLGLPTLPLVISLLAYFVVFLVLELSLLHRLTSRR